MILEVDREEGRKASQKSERLVEIQGICFVTDLQDDRQLEVIARRVSGRSIVFRIRLVCRAERFD
jgi:hypothetical protein